MASRSPAEHPQQRQNLFISITGNLATKIGIIILPMIACVELVIKIFKDFCIVNSHKHPPHYEELALLASETNFSIHEVEALYELFKKLSSSVIDDGLIHKEALQLALFRCPTKENYFADRIFNLFDKNRNGVIEFGEFVHGLSIFHPDASQEVKINFAFRLYDVRQTGYIEREEVVQMIIVFFKESDIEFTDDVIEAIVDQTFLDADFHRHQKIHIEEWKEFVLRHPSLLKNMSLPYLRNIPISFPSLVLDAEVDDLANRVSIDC